MPQINILYMHKVVLVACMTATPDFKGFGARAPDAEKGAVRKAASGGSSSTKKLFAPNGFLYTGLRQQ